MSTLGFPARPTAVIQNPFIADFEKIELPQHSAVMKAALDVNRIQLAKQLVDIS